MSGYEFKPISRCLAESAPGALSFFCLGCDMPHTVQIGDGPGARWGYNGNADAPTFTPSVLCRYKWSDGDRVCHSFITDGQIQYLGDCTHHLAGKTIELPNWEEAWANWWS